jgi:MMPL family
MSSSQFRCHRRVINDPKSENRSLMGTEYSIFLIGRYHECRRRGIDPAASLVAAYLGVVIWDCSRLGVSRRFGLTDSGVVLCFRLGLHLTTSTPA